MFYLTTHSTHYIDNGRQSPLKPFDRLLFLVICMHYLTDRIVHTTVCYKQLRNTGSNEIWLKRNRSEDPLHHDLRLVHWFYTGMKEVNILFNDVLNTFHLRLHGVRHMVKDHSDNERKSAAATWATLSD